MSRLARFLLISCVLCAACSKQDPILPGERFSVFDTGSVRVLSEPAPVSTLVFPSNVPDPENKYEQDSDNTVWKISEGARVRLFTGHPTAAHVAGKRRPVADRGFVYAGLSTGEVVKINERTRELMWVADVYKPSAMLGGSSILDIVAPVVIDGGWVYAGGLGGAFCKLRASDGGKSWCVDLSTGLPFVVAGGMSYIVATDNHLYAIDSKNGAVYWRAEVKRQAAPELRRLPDETYVVVIAREQFNAESGERVK